MAFQGQSIEEIYNEINNRQIWVERLALVNFDDEEYKVLLRISKEIIRQYDGWWSSRQQQARKVFLAFANEYTRRKLYIQDKFWDEFLATLHTDMKQYGLITKQLLWETFQEENVTRKKTGKYREFVLSLYKEVDASKATSKECVEFFHWYYKCGDFSEVTPEIIANYHVLTGHSLAIHEKAVEALNKDCQILTKIIDYAIEQGIFLLHSDLETYSRKIVNGLGAEYNPICLRLLRDRDMLRTIIIQLQNHRTPHQFLEELADNSIKKVYLPNKSHLSVIIARRQLQKETMSYGTYKLDSIEYRVVPFTWLSLELITQWRYEEIIPLRGKEYLGYKKRQSFKITIGHRTVEGRECILPNKDRCYVWADQVPQGQRIVIDSHLYNGSAGIEWHPSLELGFDENKKPLIMLLIDSLRAFYPGNRGQRLSIRTSQGHEETKYTLDNINGLCELHRAISFPLYSLAESITISIALNGELRKSKKLAFTTAYLFSASTRERIPAGTKREWGEQNYYLFAIASEQVIFGPGIVYDKIDTHLNQFVVYRLRWEEEDLPFSLAVGQLNWDFEKSRYLYLSVKHSISQEGIHLTGQQIHRFTKEHICIWTNQQLTETPSVACYLRYANEPIKINGGFQKYGNELYYFNDEAIKDLNSLTVDRDCYGKFELLFRNEKEIFGQASIIVVPELTIKGPPSTQLLAEGKIVSCTVSSHLLNLWDMKTHQKTLSIEVPIHPNLSVQPWQDNFQIPKGILHVASKAVTFFIIFPAIGETVEISLTPFVLGLRLYQRPKGQTTYQQVNNLDYYYLKNSAIYIHTHAQKQLMISINGINVREENSNDGDYLLIENLNFLKPYCQEEQNHVRIFCEDTEISFLIFWRPLIHTMTIEDNRVTLKANGPHNTSILLTLVDLSGHILKKKRVICLGKELSGYIDFLKDLYSGESLFLTSQYQMADGTVVSSTWQQRVVRQEVERMPLDWLLKGVGFSSEMLLKETVPGYTVHQQE